MHELSVCHQLIKQAGAVAQQHRALAISGITLRIGALSGVDVALLKQAFPFAAADSCAASATLRIEETPVVVQCERCGANTTASVNKLVCGECGDYHTRLISGDEMLLINVELIQQSVTNITQDSDKKESSDV